MRRRGVHGRLALGVLLIGLIGLAGVPGLGGISPAHASPPELNTDPFAPPAGRKGTAAPDTKPTAQRYVWFLRAMVGFVARFAPDRTFAPNEGFGFSFEAGAVLGQGTLRLALAVRYEYARVAREKNIPFGDTGVFCDGNQSASHHLATASALGWAEFKRVALWFGLSGGWAYAQLKTPLAVAENPEFSCGVAEAEAHTGALGPDAGVAYKLRPDLWLGVYLRYLHTFSKKRWTDNATGLSPRFFQPLLTTGVSITLRF